ncbi:MAG TPA: hypothetical protein PLD20_32490 [Blastocatellia bacterium]|nr:hypothetical protein [Blastocatellia bacterium]HMV87243.1 hypothetical protein [Blastocatellia bacterium]HMX30581.1 hypothetical protein [Blastocatellia bacterium]HMY75831.1 hypothetical protein [Blastocatellia bacterium]HMZ22692.1 hypothetical protein [Blastocatellia bacterium]
MNFRLMPAALFVFAVCSITFAQAQEPPQNKMILVEGLVETAVGCPIALSEPKCLWPRIVTEQGGPKDVHQEVKIENVSGKAIRRAIIIFRHDDPSGGSTGGITGTDSIKVGESLVFKGSGLRIGVKGKAIEGYRGIFSVTTLAVEFEDGTHWVKPRTADHSLTWQALHSQSAPLVVKQCDNIDEGYRATLFIRSDQIVAYRLGVVKDTLNSFEVRLGEWVTMPEIVTPKQTELKISAADPQVSLPHPWIFKREEVRRNEVSPPFLAGVALFVAEVKLADGTIWKQNLIRDELLWGLYK